MTDKPYNQKTKYRIRFADELLKRALKTTGAVQVIGPKWCGKTTTAERVSNTAIYFQDPDERRRLQSIAAEKPSLLLAGEKPILLDEWQDVPEMWDAVRFAVDRDNTPGQYILTGSSVIKDYEKISHTGTGRFSKVRMRTMSLFESGESNGSISLLDIVNGNDISGSSKAGLEELAFAIARGGWPASVSLNDEFSLYRARDYVDSIAESDISRVDGIEKNPKRVKLLMRSLARNESSEAKMTTLKADMESDEGDLSTNTIAIYLNALRRLFVLEEQEAWAPAVRDKTAMRSSPIRRYCDPSVAVALLRMTPEKLLVDFNTFGLLFESLCIRDLKIYAEAIDGNVFHYRDARGLEADAIIEFGDGRWGAIEIKLEGRNEEKAAASLLKLQGEVRSQHGGAASFLAIITAGGMAYRRKDGIFMVPLTCLRP